MLKLVNLEGFEKSHAGFFERWSAAAYGNRKSTVNEPKVLLLDEPLGALDLKLRQDMQYELISAQT